MQREKDGNKEKKKEKRAFPTAEGQAAGGAALPGGGVGRGGVADREGQKGHSKRGADGQ